MNGKQLKNSILQWAIQGKLVPQDLNDEPASVLLERIREEKAKLVKEKKIKKDKNESIIYRGDDNSYYEKFLATGEVKCIDEEIPFEIPNSWTWCRLNDLAIYRKGPFGSSLTKSMFVPKSSDTIKVYEQKNAIQKNYELGEYYITAEKYDSMQSFVVEPSDIIVSCAGTIGETYQLPLNAPVGIINQALMRVKLFDLSLAKYWELHFRYILLNETEMKGAGSAIKNIPPFEYLKAIIVAIPPREEQLRIIERYEQLTYLSDRYEHLQNIHEQLNNSIYSDLKKSILQEAIQGKLVPQDPSEEPGSVLLERIKAEKERLIKEKKIKHDKQESVIFQGDDNKYYERIGKSVIDITDQIPFEIPNNWCWCRLSNVISLLSGRDLTPEQYNSNQNGIPYMTGASNFNAGNLIINRWTNFPITISYKNDLLITCKGTIGELAFNQIGDIHIARQIMSLSGIVIELGYIRWFLCAIISSLKKQANSMIPGISRDTLLETLLPLPPKDEQKRIVTSINELFNLLN